MIKLKHLLKESMTVSIVGANEEFPQLERLLDIIFAIQYKALMPLNSMSPEQKAVFQKYRRSEILAPDGDSFDEPTGTINFYVQGIPKEVIRQILKNIKEQLDNLGGLTVGKIFVNRSNMNKSPVIRIPIVKNDNKYQGPPEFNVSNSSAHKIFSDMLGFHSPDEGTSYSMSVDELEQQLKPWNNASDIDQMNQMSQHTSPMTIDKDGGATMIHSGYDEERLYHYIQSLNDIVTWAKQHGYKKIVVA